MVLFWIRVQRTVGIGLIQFLFQRLVYWNNEQQQHIRSEEGESQIPLKRSLVKFWTKMSSDLRRSSGTSGGSGSGSWNRRQKRGKSSHRRKKNQHTSMSLTQDDIDFLRKNTRYDEQEIREWYKGFKVCRNSYRHYNNQGNIDIGFLLVGRLSWWLVG